MGVYIYVPVKLQNESEEHFRFIYVSGRMDRTENRSPKITKVAKGLILEMRNLE